MIIHRSHFKIQVKVLEVENCHWTVGVDGWYKLNENLLEINAAFMIGALEKSAPAPDIFFDGKIDDVESSLFLCLHDNYGIAYFFIILYIPGLVSDLSIYPNL